MIIGFKEQTRSLTTPELSLSSAMKDRFELHHYNLKNAVPASKIIKWAFKNFNLKVDGSRIRQIIHHLRVEHNMPIVGTSKGYYRATKLSEVDHYLESLNQRINSMKEIHNVMCGHCGRHKL